MINAYLPYETRVGPTTTIPLVIHPSFAIGEVFIEF